jgi:hypothetical protein
MIPGEDRLLGKHIDAKIEKDVTSIKNKITGGDSE